VYRPAVLVAAPELLSASPNGDGAILHADTHRLVSAEEPAAPGETIEIYGTGLGSGGVIPPRMFIGGYVAEVLWFGDAPGRSGLNQINVRVPSHVSAKPAVAVRMIYLERPSNQVTFAVQ
jgi:uncharacterized protein (TIGR03437 family)